MKKIIVFLIRKLYFSFWKRNIFSSKVSLKAKIEKNVFVRENTFIDSRSEIGDYTFLGRNCNITKTSIGRYCSIANNVSIGQGEHNLKKISTSSIFYENSYEELTKEPCSIGSDVWIGTDVIILRGLTIGDGVVIGANSVVTKDIPPFSIVVGSPAKIIKYRFDEKKQNIILKSKWWDLNIKEAKVKIKELEKIC